MFIELDFNGHVNNTRYIDWCMDAFPEEWHQQHRPRLFTINYLSEVRGTESIIDIQEDQEFTSGKFVQGIRKADGKVIFRARLEMQ